MDESGERSIDTQAAQAALSVRLADAGRACVVFQAERGEGPRTGSIPTLVGALLACALARLGDGPESRELLVSAERTAGAFASMAQPQVLPEGLELVEQDDVAQAQAVCTVMIPADGEAFVRGAFASADPEEAYRAFLYALQFAVVSLPPDSLVALSSVLRGVARYFKSAETWPDPQTVEALLAEGRAGISGRWEAGGRPVM